MRAVKYIISIIGLIGVTAAFLFSLNAYQNQGFRGERESDIRELELVTAKENYSAKEVAEMLLNGNYIDFGEDKTKVSEEAVREACLEHIRTTLHSIEESDIYKEMEAVIMSEDIMTVEAYQNVGYIENDAIVFTLVNVWFENIMVTYEEKTGVLLNLNYFVQVNEEASTENAESATFRDERIEKDSWMVRQALLQYYEALGIRMDCVSEELIWEPDMIIITFRLGKEEDIALEKIAD